MSRANAIRSSCAAALCLAFATPAAVLTGIRAAGAQGGLPAGLGTPVITVSANLSLTAAETRRIMSAAAPAGAVAYAARYATFPMTAFSRGDEVLMQQPKGWRIPMGTRILAVDYVRATGGDAMADVLSSGQVLMGENSALIRDAKVGDVVTLRDSGNGIRRFTVGMIVANGYADGEDLIMSTADGLVMGVTKVSRVNFVGFARPGRVVSELRARVGGIGSRYRLRTTWDPPNPDATLGIATLKLRLGEFAFRPTDSDAIMVEDAWRASRISWLHKYGAITLRNNCHKLVVGAIEAAFRDIVKAGLGDRIDRAVSQRYGGCYVGRYNRLGGLFGAPSRHAFGAAIDLNTTTNQQWARPTMDCRVVRIFRRWGFAWGGNFWPTDGMHFEWVGERRDRLGYPSRYCPNTVPVPVTSAPSTTTSTSTTTTTTTTIPATSTTTSTSGPGSTTTSSSTSTTTSP
ncbi:MAG: M15 family metallopeptidase [Acidimicrobiales bacterium]